MAFVICACEPFHGDSVVRDEVADAPRIAGAQLDCRGAALLPCDAGTTGPTCGFACVSPPPGAEDPAECGFELYCHGDGSVYGLATFGAHLFEADPAGSDDELAAALLEWIVEHEADLGLDDGLKPANLGLTLLPDPRHPMGGLTIVRFRQTYRSFPVLPPDDLVQLVLGPRGAIQLSGRILDPRVEYEDVSAQASSALAEASMVHHVSVRTQLARDDIEIEGPALVALPEAQRIAWVGQARHVGGDPLGRVIIDADPEPDGSMLPLLRYRSATVNNLGNTQAIQVRSMGPMTDPLMPVTSVETTLFDGQTLLGSVDAVSGEIQLATESVVVLDLNGSSVSELHLNGSRVLDPGGDFLAMTGAGLSAQMAHHLLHGWYAQIDGTMTDSFAGAKRWDSAYPVYFLPLGTPSPTPPGTFAPRMLAFVDAASSDCGPIGIACADRAGYGVFSDGGLAFPEIVHQPPGASSEEVTGRMLIPPPSSDLAALTTLAHEFGHLVDLFAGPGITSDLVPDCAGACALECLEDTSDEAPPLTETIAQMLGMAAWRQSFDPVDFGFCDIVDAFGRSGTKAWTPGPCIPPGEDISLFQRPAACSKPASYCDKPDDPGFDNECCDPDMDVGCDILVPETECATGFTRVVSTGLCDESPGYDTHSVMQAWWQLLNGTRCEPIAPFDCDTTSWPIGIDPLDASMSALLYSLRLNPLSYEQLIDGMAVYISCEYGAAAYQAFNEIVCAHALRDCAAPVPVTCETCGNGVREGAETCDGMDWLVADCADWGSYVSGTLQCNAAMCQLDFSQCMGASTGGADTTAGTDASTETTGSTGTSSGGAGGDPGGCSCQTDARPRFGEHGWLAMLLLLSSRRRTRR